MPAGFAHTDDMKISLFRYFFGKPPLSGCRVERCRNGGGAMCAAGHFKKKKRSVSFVGFNRALLLK